MVARGESVEQQIPEFPFEEGVEESTSIILRKLQTQPYVTVAFSWSNRSVGKSELARAIQTKISGEGISCIVYHDAGELARYQGQIMACRGQSTIDEKTVFIFDQAVCGSIPSHLFEVMKCQYETDIQTACRNLGCNVNGVDLWIGIYRPDRPFRGENSTILADILIRNVGATDN